MITVLDTEFKTTRKEDIDEDTGKPKVVNDFSPFNPDNFLVSVHVARKDGSVWKPQEYVLEHSGRTDVLPPIHVCKERIQETLDSTTLLVGHFVKIDLIWLRACGFRYDGPVFDTLNAEYILQRGTLTYAMSLEECAKRHGVTAKLDIVKDYFAKGITIDQVPLDIVIEYGNGDVVTTGELYDALMRAYDEPKNQGLVGVLELTNEFTAHLAGIESDGMRVSLENLDAIEKELRDEYDETEKRVNDVIKSVMGDRPYSSSSSEQLAQVVFSRRPRDKKSWRNRFVGKRDGKTVPINRKLSPTKFKDVLRKDMVKVEKTDIMQCPKCKGEGKIQKYKKDGSPYKNKNICDACNREGYLYIPNGEIAGFKFMPKDATWIAADGFSTSKGVLEVLEGLARANDKPEAEAFVKDVRRLNALSNYLNNFVKGIRRNVSVDGMLRPTFNQTRTATGRLSSSNPNMQNVPRGKTFPVKRAFVSRFDGGRIADIDFSGLEFRAAGELSGCPVVASDIASGVDVHSNTAKILTEAGQPTNRQEAKPHCVPLNTKALTKRGWVSYGQVSVGDIVLAYDPAQDRNVWTPVLEKVFYKDAPVVTIGHAHWKYTCTPDHRWYGHKRGFVNGERDYKPAVFTAADINSEYTITTSALMKSDRVPSDEEYLAELLGWLWTDGSITWSSLPDGPSRSNGTKRGVNAVIIQKKEQNLDRIRWLLQGKASESVRDDGAHVFRIQADFVRYVYSAYGIPYSNNVDYISFVTKLSDYCRINFLRGVKAAEGTKREHGQCRIAQNSGPLCEAIKIAATLEGYDIRVHKYISRTGKQHEQITLRLKQHVTCQRFTKTDAGRQDVWCIQTKYGTWVSKQEDIVTITGNTFKPLYGGLRGTPAQETYYKAFLERYKGVKEWHTRLQEEAISTKKVRTPTGREFSFPHVKRIAPGRASQSTKIVNYPVQSFATADIVPVAVMAIRNALRGYRSLVINSVHDSIVIDVHPEEEYDVIRLAVKAALDVKRLMKERFGVDLLIPLDVEASIGPNWFEQETVYEKGVWVS